MSKKVNKKTSNKKNNVKKTNKTNDNIVVEKKEVKVKNETKKIENNNEKYSSKFGTTKQVKNIEKINNNEEIEGNELVKLFKLVLIVCLVIAVFYGLTYFIKNHKNSSNTSESNEEYTEIQYDEIMLGEMLNRKESSYYVIAYNSKSEYSDLYNMYLSNYQLKDYSLKVYTTYIDNIFNKIYISEESNLNVTSVSDLRIKDVTLFKINDKKIENFYEGYDAVIEKLKELIG